MYDVKGFKIKRASYLCDDFLNILFHFPPLMEHEARKEEEGVEWGGDIRIATETEGLN